jgi:hypothetical protein
VINSDKNQYPPKFVSVHVVVKTTSVDGHMDHQS